jgi:hypothetical protein
MVKASARTLAILTEVFSYGFPVPLGKCKNSNPNLATIATFHILSNSLVTKDFIIHPKNHK